MAEDDLTNQGADIPTPAEASSDTPAPEMQHPPDQPAGLGGLQQAPLDPKRATRHGVILNEGESETLDENAMRKQLFGLGDVHLDVTAYLGRASIPLSQFLKLTRGSIIELDQDKDDDVDLVVNGFTLAKGEIKVVGEYVGVEVKRIVRKSKIVYGP